MAEWSKDPMEAMGSLNLYFGLVDGLWLIWRPGEALRWKVENHQLGRSGSVMWQASTSKVVASTCVG
jgi:hypothetical protein